MARRNEKKTHPRRCISEVIRELVSGSEQSLTVIAEGAGVPYQTLQKWMKGELKTISADNAELLHIYLTGNPFSEA